MHDKFENLKVLPAELERRLRCRRRFRHHVRTPVSNPKGRIHREPCCRCGEREAEAHHLDYENPFRVAWLCSSCHRKVDHGSLNLRQKDIWDYSGLVRRSRKA